MADTAPPAGTNASSEISTFCTICCVMPTVLGIVGAAIAYYVFGIIFLVDDRYVCSDMSPLWIFSLVAILTPCLYPLTLLLANEIRHCIGQTDAMRYLIISSVVNAFVFIYGAIIIYSEEYVCSNMKNAGLYTWAQVAIYLNLIALIILAVTMGVVSVNKDAESYIDNHLHRNNPDPADIEPQEAVPIPEPPRRDAPQKETDPLISRPAPVPPAAPPARTISELD